MLHSIMKWAISLTVSAHRKLPQAVHQKPQAAAAFIFCSYVEGISVAFVRFKDSLPGNLE
jgi:hypothetical protein